MVRSEAPPQAAVEDYRSVEERNKGRGEDARTECGAGSEKRLDEGEIRARGSWCERSAVEVEGKQAY